MIGVRAPLRSTDSSIRQIFALCCLHIKSADLGPQVEQIISELAGGDLEALVGRGLVREVRTSRALYHAPTAEGYRLLGSLCHAFDTGFSCAHELRVESRGDALVDVCRKCLQVFP
jgi:hypothetical protein